MAKAEEELKSRAEKIEELGQQVDDNSGAQDMVEELSEKNGKLEEVHSREVAVDDNPYRRNSKSYSLQLRS